jgi:hypothetical protein
MTDCENRALILKFDTEVILKNALISGVIVCSESLANKGELKSFSTLMQKNRFQVICRMQWFISNKFKQ